MNRVDSIKSELYRYEVIKLKEEGLYKLLLVTNPKFTNASPFYHARVHRGFLSPNSNRFEDFECPGRGCGMCKASFSQKSLNGDDRKGAKNRYFWLALTKGDIFKILDLDYNAQKAILGVDAQNLNPIAEMIKSGKDPFVIDSLRPVVLRKVDAFTYKLEGLGTSTTLSEAQIQLLERAPDPRMHLYKPTGAESFAIAEWTALQEQRRGKNE